jgi:hypothetical protein
LLASVDADPSDTARAFGGRTSTVLRLAGRAADDTISMQQNATLASFVPAVLWILTGCSTVSHHDRATAVEYRTSLVADIGDELVLDIPAGAVDIGPSADDRLHVTLVHVCASESVKCARMAQNLVIGHTIADGRSSISFRPDSAVSTRHAELVYRFDVPRADHVTVHFKAGELDIRMLDSCLSVFAGAGDIDIQQPSGSVRSVALDANVGDATLYLSDGSTRNRRKLLVGAEVAWAAGSGRCDDRVKLQAGDIRYRLVD